MTEEKKPPPFYCPSCGQKHRADLSSLLGKEPNAFARLSCAGCGIALAVSLDEDGLPICKALEQSIGENVEEAAPSAPIPTRRKGKKDIAPAPKTRSSAKSAGPVTAPSPKVTEQDAEFGEGDTIGRYTIEEVIGTGGSSAVYRAFDPTTNRTVAMKVLVEDHSETMRQRFLREIEVQANIRHQNIMPVFDRGELPDGRPYFTMELLYKPWSLSDIVEHRERGTLSRYTTLRELGEVETLIEKLIVPVCDGVYVANIENGVIHRDLKPDNVLIDSRTLRPYVIDLGICQAIDRKGGDLGQGPVVAPTADEAGIVGTPRYLAPEQAKGGVNSRTDVWGLGALLYFVVAGEPPIAGGTPITKVQLKQRVAGLKEARAAAEAEGAQHRVELCDEKLARLEDPDLRTIESMFRDARDAKYGELPATTPAALTAVIHKAMSKSQSDRYVNARQLSAELTAWIKGGGVRALREAGGTAAAVETARRAVRTHLMTAVWIVLGLVVGFFIGKALAGARVVGSSTRVEDAYDDIALLEQNIEQLSSVSSALTPTEAHRFWASMMERAKQIQTRIANEPATAELASVASRLAFVRGRIDAPRIVIDVPPGTVVRGRNTVTDKALAMQPGENTMPPGAYHVSVGAQASVRFPVRVPLVVRDPDHGPDLEPALATYTLPVKPADVPQGLVLVLGGEVRTRDLPFAETSLELTVRSFLMGQREVSNDEYAVFLGSLAPDEQKLRTPSAGFVSDPSSGLPVIVKGKNALPVVGVRPEDAEAYVAWRSQVEGVTVRLPKEAEWVLAAGAGLGYQMPNDAPGYRTDADFAPPLKAAGEHIKDESPFGVRGLLGNARELVTSSSADGTFLVKGAGVGDEPDEGAIYVLRPLGKDERQATTGFRIVQELP